MKRFMKIFSALTMIILILALSVVPSFATGELLVNGTSAQKGDTVNYSLTLGDCEEPVVGFHMYIRYDKNYLKMVENSLNFGEISSKVIHNGSNQENSDDGLIFVYSDPADPADFSTAKILASMDFEVLKEGETEVTFFVTDLFGMDMTYMKSYTFTYDLSVNKELVIEKQPPVLVTDQAFLNENQGMFVNYADGKGEKNGDGNQRETVMGVTTAPATEVLKGTEESKSLDLTTIIILVAVVLIVLIIVVLVIVRNALNRSKKENSEVLTENNNE